MPKRRHLWYILASLALLIAPFAMTVRPVQAAGTYTVTNLLDDTNTNCTSTPTTCTLRQAITSANTDGVSSTISFHSSLSGVIALNITAYGPLILTESNTKIEALINPPAITQPPIEIIGNGSGSGSSDPAFTITSSGNTIKGLSITGFTGMSQPQGAGVLISGSGATGNTITGNYIGVKPNGTTLGANVYGVRIASGASNNTISGNFIVGSLVSGVLIENASRNTFTSNLIGIGLSSTLLPNAIAGIEITSSGAGASTGNTIGGTSSEANFISSNGPSESTVDAGILIRGAGTTGNTILANLIGTDISGTADLGNHGDGVRIASGASGNSISGTSANPVIISGNNGYGIRITGAASNNNQISGSVWIGVNRNRTASLANAFGGILIDQGASGTSVSGSSVDQLLIGGNTGPGVTLAGSTTARNQLLNAYIGVAPNTIGPGTLTFANGGGILVQDSAQKTTISGNTISGNTGFGVQLSASQTVTVTGNFIGLNTDRTGTVGNVGPGIDVLAGSNNTLIGNSASTTNYLAGNSDTAITISGAGTTNTTVKYNTIGLAKDGSVNYTVPAGNTSYGILVSNGPQRTTISNNTIGSNTSAGVRVTGTGTTTVTLSLNRIGLTAVGDTIFERPNGNTGISLDTVKVVDVISNILGYNSGSGILATSVETVTIRSNQVSVHSSGSGVEINGPSRNVQILSNILSLNSGYGVLVQGDSQRVRIQSNQISENTGGGVSLKNTSISSGSAPDESVSLPNHGIDPPIFDPANTKPLRMRVDQTGLFSGWVYTNTATLPASACAPANLCQIQFFRPGDIADGQGFSAYKVMPVDGGAYSDFASPNGQGFFTGRLVLSDAEVLPGQLIFAVTDTNGNTSEFAILTVTPALSLSYLNTVDGRQSAVPDQTITYTLRLNNTGTVGLTNLNVVTNNTLARWNITPANTQPNLFSMPANSTKTLTVTLKLPPGTDENALAGMQDVTSITASAAGRLQNNISKTWGITTTVSAFPVVSAATVIGTGSAPPGGHVTHTHRFSNSGNYTATLDLTVRTIDPADSGYVWNTVLSTYVLDIPPGQNRTVDATITVPAGAQVYDAAGHLLRVTTVVTGTARSPFGSIIKTASGITGVDLVPRAQMTGNGQLEQAASGAEISFFHNVLNTSNGPARFCLNSRSNSESIVISYTSQNGVAISPPALGNCFALDAPNGVFPVLRFKALIKVTSILLPGDLESVDIYLTNADTGAEIPNAMVTDDIQITVSPMIPRIWIPMTILQ